MNKYFSLKNARDLLLGSREDEPSNLGGEDHDENDNFSPKGSETRDGDSDR